MRVPSTLFVFAVLFISIAVEKLSSEAYGLLTAGLMLLAYYLVSEIQSHYAMKSYSASNDNEFIA